MTKIKEKKLIQRNEIKYVSIIVAVCVVSLLWLVYVVFSGWNTADRINQCIKKGHPYEYCDKHVK
jgi:hypothetical protein